MTSPFFSIIIPTYNRAHTIKTPIDSIINQTFADWELVIVDDGSTDDTKKIVESYQDNRIKYVWQENQERSAARNHGIRLAKGEWICFQDSDDAYLPEHLDVLYNGILENSDYKVIRTGLIIYENGEFSKKSTIKSSRYDQFPFECFTCASFHRSLFKEFKFDERFFVSEDLHFLLKVGEKHKIKVLPSWTNIYFYNPLSIGEYGTSYLKNIISQRECLDDILSWNKTAILPYISRKRCLTEILMMYGHFRYKKRMILKALLDNIRIFFRFPKEYLKLVIRIAYVKIGESYVLYRTQGRF